MSIPATAVADDLCEGELEAIRRDHKILRANYDELKADLDTRPTKKAHDKLVAAHDALRARFKNAPKKSGVAKLERQLEKAEAKIAKLEARPSKRDIAKLRKRAEAAEAEARSAEAELETRPSAKAHAQLQAQVDSLQRKLRAANGTVDSTEGYDEVRWGMKPRHVKRAYKNLKDNGDILYYRTTIASRNAIVKFAFAKKQLARVIVELAVNDDDAVIAFNRTGKLLAKKYGAPKKRDKQWSNDRHKSNKKKWDTAIRSGDAVFTAMWETDDTRVVLTTRGSNGKAQAIIRYTSKELAPIIDSENEKKQLRGL